MATEAIYTKSLGGAEDLLLDASNSPTVIQTRAGKELEITKINSSTIPYSGKFGDPSMVSIKDQLDIKANTVSSAYVIDTVDDFGTIPSGIDTVIVKDINRGGTFIYDATQSAVNNGGTVFDGWVRQYSGAVNVKWFISSNDVSDDIGIQKAININKPLYAPSGTYLISNTLIKDTSGLGNSDGLILEGEGQENTFFDNNTGAELLLCTSGTGVERQYNTHIKSIGIINTNTSLNTIGIKFIGVWKSSIKNVKITSQDLQGILFFSSIGDYTDCAFIDILHCDIRNNGAEGIKAYVSGSSINYGLNIKENSITSNGSEGILLESAVNCRIINTGTAYNGAEGIKITRDGSNPVSKNITIENCEFDTNTSTQLTIDSARGIMLKNNYFVYNDIGVTVSKNIHFTGITAFSTSELDSHGGYTGSTGVTMFTIDATCSRITIINPNWSSWAAGGNTQFTDNGTDSTIYSDGKFLTTVKALTVEATTVKADNTCTAWVNFDGTTGAIRDSFNVSSVIRTGDGLYDITFDEVMDNTNYTVAGLAYSGRIMWGGSNTTSKVTVGTSLSGTLSDSVYSFVTVFGGKNL